MKCIKLLDNNAISYMSHIISSIPSHFILDLLSQLVCSRFITNSICFMYDIGLKN